MEENLRQIYYDPTSPVGYSGNRRKFYAYVKGKIPHVNQKVVNRFFSRQIGYTNRARAKYKYKRRQVVSYDYFDLAQADLADMSRLKRYNNGYAYILVVVGVLSKMVWTRPLKRKTGDETSKAMKDIFESFPKNKMFMRLQTDRGSEFYCRPFSKLMEEQGIVLFSSEQYDVKASIAEVNIRILKHRLWRYMDSNNTKKWSDVLQQITSSRNRSVFSGHGFRPVDVNEYNAGQVFRRLYPELSKGKRRYPLKFKYKIGQKVKLSILRSPLIHSFYKTYTDELFIIHSRLSTDPITYHVKNMSNDVMRGSVYEDEILPIYDNQ